LDGVIYLVLHFRLLKKQAHQQFKFIRGMTVSGANNVTYHQGNHKQANFLLVHQNQK
jgi:hypothetical protein